MRGRAGAGKQLSSCGRLELSKARKDYESAAEGRECFLKEVRKDKRDSANLIKWLTIGYESEVNLWERTSGFIFS